MKKRRYLWIAAAVVLVAVIGAVLLLPGDEPAQPAASPRPAHPAMPTGSVPAETAPVLPEQTEDPAQTRPGEPEQTLPSEPEQTEPEERPVWTQPPETEPEPSYQPAVDAVRFPVELEGGQLTIHSIFPFSGMNPDAGYSFGEEIAGLQVTNTSDEYLLEAEIAAVLADGTTLTFLLQDVPPGKTVMAFCLEHEPLPGPDSCEDIYGFAQFSSDADLAPELLHIRVSGTAVTLENVSGRELTNLEVTCHGLLDASLFGGTSYHYTIASLSAGASTTVNAVDCILGMTEVVRVELGG